MYITVKKENWIGAIVQLQFTNNIFKNRIQLVTVTSGRKKSLREQRIYITLQANWIGIKLLTGNVWIIGGLQYDETTFMAWEDPLLW